MSDKVSSVVNGKYYPSITRAELAALQSDSLPSSGAASFDRRRTYEDHADETIQPYNAAGPNAEFLRLYPESAEKVFNKETIEKLKSKL